METNLAQQKDTADGTTQSPVAATDGVPCPICQLSAGRLVRGKIYCGNCGFIES